MSLKKITPCDNYDHTCPYGAEYSRDCEYWCGAEEPEDYPSEEDFEEEVEEVFEENVIEEVDNTFCGDYFGDGDFSYFCATEDDYYGEEMEVW